MLAPMAEISHRGLRELIAEYDRDPVFSPKNEAGGLPPVEYFTEMLSAAALLGGGPFEKWYLDAGPCPGQLVYQLVGAGAEQLERAAAFLDELDCLGIDINMGCAAPAIRRIGAGLAWTGEPAKARALIGRLRSVVKRRRLSVKLRCPLMGPELGAGEDPPRRGSPRRNSPHRGSPQPGEEEQMLEYLIRFCQSLEAEGVQLITLHPRRAGEKFKRPARWDYVERLRRELGIPVAGNGDIGSPAELAARSRGGKAMAGRAAVRQPWIFAAARLFRAGARAPAGGLNLSFDLEKTGLRFLELLARCQPPEFHISRARRFFNYFCENLKWGTHVKNLLNRGESLKDVERAWRGYFAFHPEDRLLILPIPEKNS
ncbi:MAG: tRNA-dihydrouridine synthase family protein [Treponema sp.]|nr:tRNA-dihydrouridine synthase family protein [Treponema sp.]